MNKTLKYKITWICSQVALKLPLGKEQWAIKNTLCHQQK